MAAKKTAKRSARSKAVSRRKPAKRSVSTRKLVDANLCRLYETRELLKAGVPAKQVLRHMQLAADEELIDRGGKIEGDRYESDNPSQCVCGTYWAVKFENQKLAARPNKLQILGFLNKVPWPTKSQTCDPPCVPVETFRGAYWLLWKDNKNNQFKLFCSKRIQWHCEIDDPT